MHAREQFIDSEELPPSTRPNGTQSGVFVRHALPVASPWRTLDDRLRETLVERAVARAARDRGPSPLDGVAVALVRARGALDILTSRAAAPKVRPYVCAEPALAAALTSAYEFCQAVAVELVAIESMRLSAESERGEVSTLVPFVMSTFELLVGRRFDALYVLAEVTDCDELHAFLWDMGSLRVALARVLSSVIAA
jgi:hypothetical protein